MASSFTPSSEIIQMPRNPISITKTTPLMLKDYLTDDLSSCSSSGFKSIPRRAQCCTTVRFLLEIDLKTCRQPPPPIHNHHKKQQFLLRRSRSRAAASTTLSALQRASEAVMNAVKSLPFHSVKSPSSRSVQNRARNGKGVLVFPRSLSRRLWRRSFWKKSSNKEEEQEVIGRWRSFREFLQDQDKPSDQTTTTSSSNSNSWGESEFTVRSSSGNSESSSGNDVVESKTTSLVQKKVSDHSERVGVAVGEDSIERRPTTTTCSPQKAKDQWLIKEEKEQFSPVSVLDCPFEDEEDDDSGTSPFRCRLARMEGTQQKLMQKIRRFENLAQLDPVDVEKRINAMSEEDEDEATAPSVLTQPCIYNVRNTPDKLVLDLLRERAIVEKHSDDVMQEVLKVAEEWANGQSRELLLGWEVEEGRRVYVNDMDDWRKMEEEKEEVGLEVEVGVWVWDSLVDDLILDLISR